MTMYFGDPDGDILTYMVDNTAADVIDAEVDGYLLTLTAIRPRQGSITVIAADPSGETAEQTIEYEAHPNVMTAVWSQNGPDGESYEFAVNCDAWPQPTLSDEDCFLWDLTAVTVTGPGGQVYNLEKNFKRYPYSGEVTQGWVLYGPAGAGFPTSGTYTFRYYGRTGLEYEQTVPYTLQYIDYVTNIEWKREGNDLVVQWEPPKNPKGRTSYKVILQTFDSTGKLDKQNPVSLEFDFGVRSARLPDIPLEDGTPAMLHIAVYFTVNAYEGGYAYSDYIRLTW